jgi:5-methylcytosine-specific restriction endonuclease McrA
MTVRRGTSNGNKRGSAEQRRKRKLWLLETYRANVDVTLAGDGSFNYVEVLRGEGIPCARCYRCGRPLTFNTMTVDKIIPACEGGTYRRNNIRPACSGCNSETGGALAHRKRDQEPQPNLWAELVDAIQGVTGSIRPTDDPMVTLKAIRHLKTVWDNATS